MISSNQRKINEFLNSDDKLGLHMKAIMEITKLKNELENSKKRVTAEIRKLNKIHSGMKMTDRGYIVESVKRKNKKVQIFQHRVVAEAILGRALEADEVVHHIDGNKWNNSPKNLIITNQEQHMKIHKVQEKSRKQKIMVDN